MDGQACLHRHMDIRQASTASGIYAVSCAHRKIGQGKSFPYPIA